MVTKKLEDEKNMAATLANSSLSCILMEAKSFWTEQETEKQTEQDDLIDSFVGCDDDNNETLFLIAKTRWRRVATFPNCHDVCFLTTDFADHEPLSLVDGDRMMLSAVQ